MSKEKSTYYNDCGYSEHKINLGIFDIGFNIIIIDDGEDMPELNDKNHFIEGKLDEDAMSYTGNRFLNNYLSILFYESCDVGHIAHEAKHALNSVFYLIGHQLSTENDEIECYMLEYLVREISKCFEKHDTLKKLIPDCFKSDK